MGYKLICLFILSIFQNILGSISSNCQSPLKVSGQFKGLKSETTVYLTSSNGKKDSVKTTSDGQFKFTRLESMVQQTFFIKLFYDSGRFDFPIFLLPNSILVFEVNDSFSEFSFSGDRNAMEQDSFYRFRKRLFKIKDSVDKLSKLSSENFLNQSEILKQLDTQIEQFTPNWIKTHLSSPFSLAALRLFKAKTLKYGSEDFEAEELYDLIYSSAKENNAEQNILEGIFSIFNPKYGRFGVGAKIDNIQVRDTLGNELKFNLAKNRFTLLDFWASWCAPCRANTPYLNLLNNEFKSKGLQVVSISLDTDAFKWKQAIIKDKMTWLNGSDLLGQDSGIGYKYGINAVPLYVLLDSEGMVIAQSVGGDFDLIRRILNDKL